MHFASIALSLAEGFGLILSPCILPVLPLILSASLDGGKKRPFGVIAGFTLSFALFAYLSREAVSALHLNLEVIRYGSLMLLALFGLVLLSERLSAGFAALTQRFASFGAQTAQGNGFFSGMLAGALIGLVWTPCAGPILAAVLVQLIQEHSNAQALLQLLAFAFGAGLPMLFIALLGKRVMGRMRFFTRHAEGFRKGFGVLILLSAGFIASGADPQSLLGSRQATAAPASGKLEGALAHPYPAPELAGIASWLGSPPLKINDLRGKVVLVDFWTYSCINCLRTLPYLTEWDKRYRDKGLVIIGVHAPEFAFEKNRDNVMTALGEHGIHYPVALDNHLDSWSAFHNQYWPAHYLIDRTGQVVYTHFGEGKYSETEHNIQTLLGIGEGAVTTEPTRAAAEGQTEETYLGYGRMRRFASLEPVSRDQDASYRFPAFLPLHRWALEGKWRIGAQSIEAREPGAKLRFDYMAGKVYLVLGSASGRPVRVRVIPNGDATQAKTLTIDRHALYTLVDQPYGNGLLELEAAPGLEAYALTFGK
jgi:cytochrome c biogenesis protein CcdA/thiol-disulfide isomerase/thioredoxin